MAFQDGQADAATGASVGGTSPGAAAATTDPAATTQPAGVGERSEAATGAGLADDGKPIMTPEQLNERIARAKASAAREAEDRYKAQLREQFGTDDLAKIKGERAELQKLKDAEESRKRAQMSETERLKADLERERQKREQAEAKARDTERARRFDKQDQTILAIAAKHVDDKAIRYARHEFAQHVKTLATEQIKAMTDKDVAKWFADLAKREPIVARQAPPSPAPAKRSEPVTSGSSPKEAKPQSNAGIQGKTPRPGQQNSMSKSEYRQWLKDRGYAY